MAQDSARSQLRMPRRTTTYRGGSRSYFGFTEFHIDDPLPHAAGVYMLASECVGPERWRIVLIGETSDFSSWIPIDPANKEARRRGANRILLHFSPLPAAKRQAAAQDLWMSIRAPLVGWETADFLSAANRA